MWKLLVTAAMFVHLGVAQRSSYAARPGSHSKLLARYRTNTTQSSLVTRGGEEEDTSTPAATFASELQGTLEDPKFVQRVSQWPAERQPFWFKNRYAISSMRDRDIDGGELGGQGARPQFASSFQGASSGRGRARETAAFVEDYPHDGAAMHPLYDPFIAYFRTLHG